LPSISLIILNWNGRELLQACLRSLERNHTVSFETIVVDNGSTDGSPEMVAREFGWARLVRQEQNVGYCRGNNVGLRAASGEVLVLLNNDAEVAPDFIEQVSRAAEVYPEAGMFATRIMMYDRASVLDSAGLLVYPDGICRSRGWLDPYTEAYESSVEVLGPNGCAAVYRRAMLDDVGLFDERYFAYLEDLDLAMRGQLRGWTCRYIPEAVVHHKKSMTSGYHSAFKAYLVERNRIWNAVKLFPLRLLVLSPFYTLARYTAQGFAALAGRGISSSYARDYSRLRLAAILVRSYASALRQLPAVWADRRLIQRRRRLGAVGVYTLMRRYRLPIRELAFKD
jgi:GT2 family glycosyltransferase